MIVVTRYVQARIFRKTISAMKTCFLIASASLSFATMTCKGQVADAGPDTTLCVDSYTMLGSALPPGATGQWVLYTGCATFTQPSSPTTLITNLCIGENIAGWVVNDNGTITLDQVAITVYDPDMPFANAGMDQTIVGPQNWAQLSGSPTPIWPATCSWTILTGPSILNDPTDPYAIAGGLGTGENIFLWTCENGPCWSSPTADTVVIQMMMVVNGLSTTEANSTNSLAYDPSTQEVRVLKGTVLEAMEVTDIRGRSITRVGRGTRSISMADRPDGIYLARAIMDDRPVVLRFVVTH